MRLLPTSDNTHVTLDRLIAALVRSDNDAADDTLLEALRLGNEAERAVVIDALLRRKRTRGLTGLIEQFPSLSEPLQAQVLRNINVLHHALREAGRSDKPARRLSAMQLIAIARQGSLAYVLGENLHEPDERVSKAAASALVAMARWASVETRALQRGRRDEEDGKLTAGEQYPLLISQRADIEQAVGRAIDSHRGRHGQDLLRAALLLCDSAGSKTFEILKSTKHGGQGAMVRRLQQTAGGPSTSKRSCWPPPTGRCGRTSASRSHTSKKRRCWTPCCAGPTGCTTTACGRPCTASAGACGWMTSS